MPRAFGAGARAISSSSFLRSQARSAAKGKVAAPSIFSASFLPTSMQQTGARFIHFQRQTVGTVSQKFATVSRQAERVTAQLRRFSQSASDKTGGIAAWYNGLLEKSPLLTKAVTSALIVLGGDLGCQLFIEGGSIDFARLARMFFLGGVLVAPVLHVWYGALFRWFPSPSIRGVLTRVVLDQAVFAPIFCGVFFTAIFATEGRLDQLENHLRENYVDAVKVNWMMWIPAQIINFKFVPPQLQVLFANFVALFWNSYLSWSGHKDQHIEDATPAAAAPAVEALVVAAPAIAASTVAAVTAPAVAAPAQTLEDAKPAQ